MGEWRRASRCREHQVRGGDADRGLAAACRDDRGARGCPELSRSFKWAAGGCGLECGTASGSGYRRSHIRRASISTILITCDTHVCDAEYDK